MRDTPIFDELAEPAAAARRLATAEPATTLDDPTGTGACSACPPIAVSPVPSPPEPPPALGDTTAQ